MSKLNDVLPKNWVLSFEVIPFDELKNIFFGENRIKASVRWGIFNEIKPSDLYCYLFVKFGIPNGMQNFLRKDDSDNLVHWEWVLKTSEGFLSISGLNYRTEVVVLGHSPKASEKQEFIRQINSDIKKYRKKIFDFKKNNLEPWIEFVNPYQRLRRAVKLLLRELDGLKLDPSSDSLPSLLGAANITETQKIWSDRAVDYTKAIGLSFGIRSMMPVMAEAFVNLLFFTLARPSVRKDEGLFKGIFRQSMVVRVKSLPYYCIGFSGVIDGEEKSVVDYFKLIDTRNDLLHGNINVDRLKFNELFFSDRVPIFNEYSTMWERSLGISYRAVGLQEVHRELQVVEVFIEYIMSKLQESVREQIRFVGDSFNLGFRTDNGRVGFILKESLPDFGIPEGHESGAEKTLSVMVIDGAVGNGSL
ncbi:MAG: hypothetical protein RR779_11580 [Comamonas sp.]